MRPSTTAVAAKPLQFDLCCSTHRTTARDGMTWRRPTKHLREPSRRRGSPRRRRGARRHDCWRRPSRPRSAPRAAAADTTLRARPRDHGHRLDESRRQRCFPPAGALALAMVTAKANRSIRRASTGSSARGSARSAPCGNSAPAGARAIVSASWSGNEDEGVVEGCCVRVGNYELNDTFVLEPGEHVQSLEANAVTRIVTAMTISARSCGLHFGSTEGQFMLREPLPGLGEAEGKAWSSLITVAPARSFALSTGASSGSRPIDGRGCRASTRPTGSFAPWASYMVQGRHRPGAPRAPERFSDAATARADAVLALASADRGPLSRLPERGRPRCQLRHRVVRDRRIQLGSGRAPAAAATSRSSPQPLQVQRPAVALSARARTAKAAVRRPPSSAPPTRSSALRGRRAPPPRAAAGRLLYGVARARRGDRRRDDLAEGPRAARRRGDADTDGSDAGERAYCDNDAGVRGVCATPPA